MNLGRWSVPVGAAFIFVLLAVSATYGQQFALTMYPTNAVANQPITFNFQTVPNSWNNVRIASPLVGASLCRPSTGGVCVPVTGVNANICPPVNTLNFIEVPQNTIIYETPNGITATGPYLTFSYSLPAGSYVIILYSLSENPNGPAGGGMWYGNSCWDFTVTSQAPVPETPSVLLLLLPAMLVGVYVLRRRRLTKYGSANYSVIKL
jgi:hypothetical protein